jgi:hypothetical protein
MEKKLKKNENKDEKQRLSASKPRKRRVLNDALISFLYFALRNGVYMADGPFQ